MKESDRTCFNVWLVIIIKSRRFTISIFIVALRDMVVQSLITHKLVTILRSVVVSIPMLIFIQWCCRERWECSLRYRLIFTINKDILRPYLVVYLLGLGLGLILRLNNFNVWLNRRLDSSFLWGRLIGNHINAISSWFFSFARFLIGKSL